MAKLNNIILVTYDNHRPDYPIISYSVASMLATLKHYKIPASYYSFDINKFKKTNEGLTPFEFIEESDSIIDYLKKFDCIAFGVSRWSEPFAYMLIKRISDYKGKIVVGGYEITAMNDQNDLSDYGIKVDHYIRGYAEKPLVKLMSGEYTADDKWIYEELDESYLYSPYDFGILNTNSRKLYWETKRGCNYKCGFCEWGNSLNKSIHLSYDTLQRDIEIFSNNFIEEINILDATFNIGNDCLQILTDLIVRTTAKITFQARFESLSDNFIHFCSKHKERLHLEFGLQTIHKSEMEVIGRKNYIPKIKKCLDKLKKLEIDYEVSIIYAIPGQTITSLIDTIEFLRCNGCTNIKAYPLQIPQNSELQKMIKEYKITFLNDCYHVNSVNSAMSFTKDERFDMDCIAVSLAHEEKVFAENVIDGLRVKRISDYQNEITDNLENLENTSLQPILTESFIRYQTYAKLTKGNNTQWNIDIKKASKGNIIDFSKVALGLTPYIDLTSDSQRSVGTYYKTVIGQSGFIYQHRI